jgi:hypothetical protein
MIGSFDLRDIQESTEGDLCGLGIYLQQLEGERFLFFRPSYAGELTIHFGTPVDRKSAKLKNRVRGSYVLTVRGSLWRMLADNKRILVISDLPKIVSAAELKKLSSIDLEKTPLIKQGTQLTTVVPFTDELSGGIGLYLSFADYTSPRATGPRRRTQ